MRLLKLFCGGVGVCLLTAGTIWAFAEPVPEPIHTALLPACGAGKCATGACSTGACPATAALCPSGACPLSAETDDHGPTARTNRDLRNYDSVLVAHVEKACAADSSCEHAECDGECCQSGDCEAACCTKAVSAEDCSKSGECCAEKTIPVTVVDAACAEGACCAESQGSCCKEGCDRKAVSTEACEHCDKNCDKDSCQHETLSALAGKLLIGAGVSSNTGEECSDGQCDDGECCKGGSCENVAVTSRLHEVKPSAGPTARVHVTITVAHHSSSEHPVSGGCAAACPAPHEPVVARVPELADYLFDPRDGAGFVFTDSFWQPQAAAHSAACPAGVCPRAALGRPLPPALPMELSAGPRHFGPAGFCPFCRMTSSPAMRMAPVVAFYPMHIAGPGPMPMAPMFNAGLSYPMAPPVAAAPPMPMAPPLPVAPQHAGRPQVSAHPLSMLGPRVAYLPHNGVSAPPAPIQPVSFDNTNGMDMISEPPQAHHPAPRHHSGDPAILGSWVRETSNSTIHITCERTRIQGTATLTIDDAEMTIQFSGTCSITPDGQLFGVIDHVELESSDPDAESVGLGIISSRMIDQPFAIHFRGNDEALFVKDVKCAGTAWFNDPEDGLRVLNVFGCGKYVPDSE